MVPVVGQPQNFTYVDPQFYYHSNDSEYTASLGAGQRWLTPDAGILGAYVFGDYNHSDDGHQFWFVSPGVERLGQILDFSANVYIPVSTFFVPNTTTPGAAQGNGTFENPYIGVTQDNVNDANVQNNRNFYINSGTYTAIYGMNDPDYIVLNNDQLFGRTNNFRQSATGSNRPLINFANGGFEVPDGDVYDSFSGLQLKGQLKSGNAGVWIDHASSASKQTVTIDNTSVEFFGDGVDLLNNADSTTSLTINNSLISNNSGGGELLSTLNEMGGLAVANTGALYRCGWYGGV